MLQRQSIGCGRPGLPPVATPLGAGGSGSSSAEGILSICSIDFEITRRDSRKIDNVSDWTVRTPSESNLDCQSLQSIGCNFLIHKYQSTDLRENRKLAL